MYTYTHTERETHVLAHTPTHTHTTEKHTKHRNTVTQLIQIHPIYVCIGSQNTTESLKHAHFRQIEHA